MRWESFRPQCTCDVCDERRGGKAGQGRVRYQRPLGTSQPAWWQGQRVGEEPALPDRGGCPALCSRGPSFCGGEPCWSQQAGQWEAPLPAGSLRVPLPAAAVPQLAEGWRDFLLVHCVLCFQLVEQGCVSVGQRVERLPVGSLYSPLSACGAGNQRR